MKGITKRFPGVLANNHISLEIRHGEIHGLLGENGAGKSTLMNILSGFYRPDAGEILMNGQRATFSSPRDAIRLGVGMVHQNFMLVPTLSVTENVILGTYTTGRVLLHHPLARRRVRAAIDQIRLQADPDAQVGSLPVGAQQKVEILKLLFRGARIFILDEPTSVLAPQEVNDLIALVRDLARQGRSVIFVTHKLREIMAAADRITVLRAGRVVETVTAAQTTETELARMMVGRDVPIVRSAPAASPGNVRLRVSDLAIHDDRGSIAVDGLSFSVRAGEILGIAGVEGNGQRELIEALSGLRRPEQGEVVVDDTRVSLGHPRVFIRRGVATVHEDRVRFGLLPNLTIAENCILPRHDRSPFAKNGLIQWPAIVGFARQVITLFDVRPPDPHAIAFTLSGGNQQKLLLARELSRVPGVIVAAQPTRGLDIQAVDFIHRKVWEARDNMTAILLVSSDLEELLKLSDRIAVIYRGRLIGEFPAAEADLLRLGQLMTTGADGPSAAT